MHKKLMASGAILFIMGFLMIVHVSEENRAQVELFLLFITGHVIGVIGLILVLTGLGMVLADRM